jgi:hypothetical protein
MQYALPVKCPIKPYNMCKIAVMKNFQLSNYLLLNCRFNF